MIFDIWFLLLCVSIILIIGLACFLLRMRSKKQIHYAFLSLIFSIFIWSFGNFLLAISNFSGMLYVYFYFIGVIGVPVSFAFVGLIFARTNIEFNMKYKLLLIFPIVDYMIIVTNKYHKLFFIKFSPINSLTEYGRFYMVHTIILYIYMFVGLGFLLTSSMKNSGFFSRQSLLIILGACIPFVFNICENFQIITLPIYITPVAFSFAILLFALAIFKFDFLNVVPIALQRIVDIISDGFLVIDEEYNIVDFNKTLLDTFGSVLSFKRKDNLIKIIKENKSLSINPDEIIGYFKNVTETKKSIILENHFICNDFDKFFEIEMTPIFSEDNKKVDIKVDRPVKLNEAANIIGIIILLKDITEHKKNIEAIKEQQAILLEQERLASLGQLIGGIAHNLKTPIMSISGGIEALKDLTYEYRDSIGDKSVTDQDHREIAKDMLTWLEKMGPYCAYMSDVISAVKGQAVQMISTSSSVKFTVDEVVKRVGLLLKHELKKYHCVLNINSNIDMSTEIKGEVNNLVQVFDNIIINAMQAYEGENGTIDLGIVRSGDNVEFTFKDNGKGIPKDVADRLFKEMITTKGKNGTGLGLYMSYSTIKGRFGGNMSFTTKEGCGTTFYISIPCISYSRQEAG